MTLQDILSRFPKIERHPGYVKVHCPAHKDDSPSLAVKEGDDGKILLKCHAGCDVNSICGSLGIKLSDLFADDGQRGSTKVEKREEVYLYQDASGREVFRKRRYYVRNTGNGEAEPKKMFAQEAKKPDGSWDRDLSKLNGQAKLLYRLPEVIKAAREGRRIWINEGEKACESFRLRGEVATCQPDGAGPSKWQRQHTMWLKGASEVVIVVDRDQKGEEYAREVYRQCKAEGIPVRCVQTKTIADHDDAHDHFTYGGKLDDFIAWRPNPSLIRRTAATQIQEKEVTWLWEPYLPQGMITMIEGDPDIGKSWFTCAIASAFSRGDMLQGFQTVKQRGIIFATEDDPERTIIPRLKTFSADMSMIDVVEHSFPFDRAGLAALEEEIIEAKAGYVILDPFLAFVYGALRGNGNRGSEMTERAIMDELKAIAERTQCAIIGIRHLRKGSEKDSNALYSGIGSIDIVASCRSALAIKYHPDIKGLRLVFHYKGNLAPKGRTMGYEIKEGRLLFLTKEDESAQVTLDDLQPSVQKERAEKGAVAAAETFIRKYLDGGMWHVSDTLFEDALKQGVKRRTIFRAKENMPVEVSKAGFSDGKWRWRITVDEAAAPAESSVPRGLQDALPDGDEYDPFADE